MNIFLFINCSQITEPLGLTKKNDDSAKNTNIAIALAAAGSGGSYTFNCSSEPFQIIYSVPSGSTESYRQKNGINPDYITGSGIQMSSIGGSKVFFNMGTCRKLVLAGNKEGTKPIGWDNLLVVEYRVTPSSPVSKRWYYGSYDDTSLKLISTGESITQARIPTVPGSDIGIPNGAPFGHEPKAIDLMTQIPEGSTSFELTFIVLDYGTVGSTTDVFVMGQEGENLDFIGGTKYSGNQPTCINNTTSAPKLANLVIAESTPGQALSGSFEFSDSEGDVKDLFVQVYNNSNYYYYPITDSEKTNKKISLERIVLGSGFSTSNRPIHFILRDAQGNCGYVDGYLKFSAQTAVNVCGNQPIQIISYVPMDSTQFFTDKNGVNPDYSFVPNGNNLASIGGTRLYMNVGKCTKLYLSGNLAGTARVGWDNLLLVEYRKTPSSPISKRWVYAAQGSSARLKSTGDIIDIPQPATVAGTVFNIPNSAPFGYETKAINLMDQIPAGETSFDLNLIILDEGYVGTTTDVFVHPE